MYKFINNTRSVNSGKTVSLVLGSGAARGLTHIGIINILRKRGYQIKAISGASIGALIGGVYAMRKLSQLTDWLYSLDRLTVFRLVDFTLMGEGGFIKGEKVLDEIQKIVGDCNIEDLPIPFTAVAADVHTGQEVWINQGSLFEAIRASIAIPSILPPKKIGDYVLIDGGVVNPVPIEPVKHEKNDLIIAVNLNGHRQQDPIIIRNESVEKHILNKQKWIHALPKMNAFRSKLSYLQVANRTGEIMMEKMTAYSFHYNKPDVIINISTNACAVYEFYRAKEMVDLGEKSCIRALDAYHKLKAEKASSESILDTLWDFIPYDFKDFTDYFWR